MHGSWDSRTGSEALVLVAIQLVCWLCIYPFLITLTDWRNVMIEEAEALVHSSVQTKLALKSCVVLVLLLAASALGCAVLSACISTLRATEYWLFMLIDLSYISLPFICFGLYSKSPLQVEPITHPYLHVSKCPVQWSYTICPCCAAGDNRTALQTDSDVHCRMIRLIPHPDACRRRFKSLLRCRMFS